MTSRAFCIPGIFFLFSAFVLGVLVSISLPSLPALDIARVHFNGSPAQGVGAEMSQLRFGIWAYCTYDASTGQRVCIDEGHGYSLTIHTLTNNESVTIGSSWTRGLAVHPVATGVTLIALLLSFSSHVTVTLISSLVSGLATLLTLLAFAIDIALYAYVKHKLGGLDGVSERTITGPGFWITFATFILLLLASCTVCFGRRRERMSGATSYPTTNSGKRSFLSRFRKN